MYDAGTRAGLLATGLTLMIASQWATASVSVEVGTGRLIGSTSAGVQRFLGIPYAEAPTGEHRWRAPRPALPWKGERAALEHGPACPQPEDRLYRLTPPVQDEDCLFLNIWSPAPPHDAPLPVLVWIHGGANRMGAGSINVYDGQRLAARGAVVVTLNYRLGYLGFFSHPALMEEGEGGNFGLMDQILALRWIQSHIAAFGGDPSRVTVFGESAGGANILYLMTTPAANGLFHRAIVQSGGGWNQPPDGETYRSRIVEDLERLGVSSKATAADLRAMDARQFVAAQGQTPPGFGPWLDQVVTAEPPWRVFREGRAASVPLVIGSNSGEGSLLKLRKPRMRERMISHLPTVRRWYRNEARDAADRRELLFRDVAFGAPARWIADHHSAMAETWLYYFDHVPASRRAASPRAGHAAEIAYVFDNLDQVPALQPFLDDTDRALAAALADCWVHFAEHGQAACALAEWPRYNGTDDQLLWLDGGAAVRAHPANVTLDAVSRYFGPGAPWGPSD
jgi:para-nitrobenzyl esterase